MNDAFSYYLWETVPILVGIGLMLLLRALKRSSGKVSITSSLPQTLDPISLAGEGYMMRTEEIIKQFARDQRIVSGEDPVDLDAKDAFKSFGIFDIHYTEALLHHKIDRDSIRLLRRQSPRVKDLMLQFGSGGAALMSYALSYKIEWI